MKSSSASSVIRAPVSGLSAGLTGFSHTYDILTGAGDAKIGKRGGKNSFSAQS